MKALKITLVVIALLFIVGFITITGGMSNKTGYADMSFPNAKGLHTKMILSIGPMAIGPLRWAISRAQTANGEEPEEIHPDLELLTHLEGIRLRIYEVDSDRDVVHEAIEKSRKNLIKQGWELVVSVREESERVLIMTESSEEKIHGLSVMVLDETEAVFVNVMGSFRPDEISAFISQMQENQI